MQLRSCALVILLASCVAQTRPASTQPGDRLSVTEHSLDLPGGPLRYRATAGTLLVKDEQDKPKASFFFTAYERLGEPAANTQPASRGGAGESRAARPVTFVFNGGPGAAAVWLHLGIVGPQRIAFNADGSAPPPPARLIPNPDTWLDATDLVFIDPVGTGFSRPAADQKGDQFFGVQEDIASVGDLIRLYCTRYQRWSSPKFLAGESYGTTRAAGLSEHLLDRYGIALNGIIFISTVLDFQTLSPSPSNDLPYVLYLPTYTATALYHKKLSPELQANPQQTVEAARRFALGEYSAALLQGAGLAAEARTAVVDRLVQLTGLPRELVEKSDLRVAPGVFEKNLLGGYRLVGRFDARIVGDALDPVQAEQEYDPSFTPFFAAYSTAFNDYVRRELGFESDLPYEVLTGRVHPWNYGRVGTGYLTTSDNLRNAMTKNPAIRVLFCSGRYDLATPFLGTDYTVSHMNLSAALRKNVVQTYYDGGHMLYHVRSAGEQLKRDVAEFIRGSVPR